MLILLRVYRDGLVIHAETYDNDEYPPAPPAHLRCRCMPVPIWRTRESALRREFRQGTITATTIYPANK